MGCCSRSRARRSPVDGGRRSSCSGSPAAIAVLFLAFAFDFLPHYPYDSTGRYFDTRISGRALNAVLLGQNYHLVHHLWTTIPWYRYQPVFGQIRGALEARGCRIEPVVPAGTRSVEVMTAQRLKMQDLERATGVGRETIRFYIREGLLPEPERPSRNVAWYDESFVERVALIKELQQKRFLPLHVIKAIVGNDAAPSRDEVRTLLELDGKLFPAVGSAPEMPADA